MDLRACEKITNEALTALEEAGIVVHHPNEVDEGDEVPVLPDDHVVSSGEDWESDEEYDDDYLDYDDYYDSMYGVD